jgi:hypothetical protein
MGSLMKTSDITTNASVQDGLNSNPACPEVSKYFDLTVISDLFLVHANRSDLPSKFGSSCPNPERNEAYQIYIHKYLNTFLPLP